MSRLDDLLRRLQQHGPLPFLDGDGSTHSYNDLLAEIGSWSERLIGRGIHTGNVVALRADYSLHSIALFFALLKSGAIVVLVPHSQAPDIYLRESCASWFCDMGTGGDAQWRYIDDAPDHELLQHLRMQEQGGIVIFTSGSTGVPKAALQSTERFLAKFVNPGRRMRTLAFLLFDHVAGMDTLLYTLANGGTLVITRRRDPESILQVIDTLDVEVLPTSPSFLRLLCLNEDLGRWNLSSLSVITYGSEPMDPATLARLNQRFPKVRFLQKYGTTETGSPRTVSRDSNSLWLRLTDENVETRITDGVLWIRSDSTILGYLNAPSPVDARGWYCTGDKVDVDGQWIRFVGRDSDTINVGGEKVSPTEVEQVIMQMDEVREAVVRGEKHPLVGQIVTARVVLAPGCESASSARRIRIHCSERLARHKVPVKIDVETTSLAGERQKVLRNHP